MYVTGSSIGSFAMMPNWLMKDRDINPGAKICYTRLYQYAGNRGYAFPTQDTLANEIGVSVRQLRYYLKDLEEVGLIEVHSAGSQNVYLLLHKDCMLTEGIGSVYIPEFGLTIAAPDTGSVLPPDCPVDTGNVLPAATDCRRQSIAGPEATFNNPSSNSTSNCLNNSLNTVVTEEIINPPIVPPLGDVGGGKDAVLEVFEYWQSRNKRSRTELTKERADKIRKRLKTYSVEDMKKAIDGCLLSRYHNGENEHGTNYNRPETIFRNDTTTAQHIERLKYGGGGKAGHAPPGANRVITTAEERRNLQGRIL